MSRVDIRRFFEFPFYILSYPVSAGPAPEIYEHELSSPGSGIELFHSLAKTENSGLIAAAAETGRENPFAAQYVDKIAAFPEQLPEESTKKSPSAYDRKGFFQKLIRSRSESGTSSWQRAHFDGSRA